MINDLSIDPADTGLFDETEAELASRWDGRLPGYPDDSDPEATLDY